ncbi:hypothetical protein JRO89_XS14G0039800 [Xanthoceras sorbifolium]|uniref:Exocyst complex component Sec8 n=1 Tax=Xanthoceras sorbifolium TaxID=99658 RepID=A0ABQ8H3M7_9ROSI|nr:hypothetical protein JRO89_XS14G0039800 [Xanthoceras sorbifolium]
MTRKMRAVLRRMEMWKREDRDANSLFGWKDREEMKNPFHSTKVNWLIVDKLELKTTLDAVLPSLFSFHSYETRAVLEKQSYMLIGRHDIEKLMRIEPASASLPNENGQSNIQNITAETVEVESELSELLLSLPPIRQTEFEVHWLAVKFVLTALVSFTVSLMQENLIRDDNKLVLMASLSDSLELGQATLKVSKVEENSKQYQTRSSVRPTRDVASFADEYRKLAVDCLKVLRIEMQLETIFHMQACETYEMTSREYLDDQDAEEPDDFIISLIAQITRRDEEMAPFVAADKRNYIFGGICSIVADTSIKVCMYSLLLKLG